jgi:nucleotide-binding universal stress UspA family protein
MKTIVCAVDESIEAAEALKAAARLSDDLGLRLVIAHVAAGSNPASSASRLDQIVRGHGLNGCAERRAEVGDRASELVRIASEEAAALIVIGARSRGRRRLVSGLTAELSATSPCPVLVVPPPWR